jgi:hypothetical protein
MSYRYLTRSYVEWLGLPRVPIFKPRNTSLVFVGMNDTLPVLPSSYAEGVQRDGVLYEREADGLAYTRLESYD